MESYIIHIQQTKLNNDEIDKLKKRLGIWKSKIMDVVEASGGLAMLWDPNKVNFTVSIKKSNGMGEGSIVLRALYVFS